MLDGIRMVTQLLTGLTHGITELGTTAPIFGMVGGAASLIVRMLEVVLKVLEVVLLIILLR